MYENWKILKSKLNQKQEEYSKVAQWCNESGQYHIEGQGEYYAVVENPEPTEDEIKKSRISELKQKLAETDYIVAKIAETETEEEKAALREEYAEQLSSRKAWRVEINELES